MAPKPKDQPQQGSLADRIIAGQGPMPTLEVEDKDTRRPIGLPEETLAETRPGFKPFITGDEYGPGSLSPADRLRIQLIMQRSGLLGEDYSPGVWDPRSANAYQNVLALANSMGTRDVEAVLGEYALQAQTYGTKVKKPRAALTVSYANPESVRQVVRDSSYKLLGRRLGDSEESALVSAYQSQYVAAQQAQYAATGEGGGSYVEPMSMEDFAQGQLEARPEASQQRYLQAFDKAMEVFTGTVVPVPRGLGG
jgi:hypothetical protein